jgi:hypothetical protein
LLPLMLSISVRWCMKTRDESSVVPYIMRKICLASKKARVYDIVKRAEV